MSDPSPLFSEKTDGNQINAIKARQTEQLIIGFCGATGSGIKGIIEDVKAVLETDYRYDVVIIKLSDYIDDLKKNQMRKTL